MLNKNHKKIIFCVHGASSFIGKNFCKLLISKKYRLVILSRGASDLNFLKNKRGVKIYRYRHSISELIGKVKVPSNSVFVNLAWAGVFGTEKNKSTQITINIPQIISSVEFAKDIRVRHWIGFGSQAEYAKINQRIDEKFPCEPETLYGKAKLISSTISMELCQAYGIEYSWLRLFSTYGSDGNHNWLIDYLIDEMSNNRKINVTKCEQYLDYLYVDDISNLLIYLGDSKGVGVVNLGSGKATQLKKVIEIIRSLTKSKSIINYGAVPNKSDQGMFNEADISKVLKLTGWKPKVSIKQGLSKIIKPD